MIRIVGADIGRDGVKAFTAERSRVSFKSRVGEWREMRLRDKGNYRVEIDGERFFVDELASESFFVREMACASKIHQETKVLFLTALGLFGAGCYRVITGLPVNYHTPEEKGRFLELMAGRYEVCVNGARNDISIEDVAIVPEGGGAYWDVILDHAAEIKDCWLASKKVRVIDIGSRTINYLTIDQKKYIDRDSGTLGYGMMELHNSGSGDHELFTRRIYADLSKLWLDYEPERDVVLFAGGGTIPLDGYLQKCFPFCRIVNEPVFANARGYYKMGVSKWQ